MVSYSELLSELDLALLLYSVESNAISLAKDKLTAQVGSLRVDNNRIHLRIDVLLSSGKKTATLMKEGKLVYCKPV